MANPATILCVDDCNAILQLIDATLKNTPWTLILVETYADAVEILNERPVDIVLVDVHLAGGSNINLADHIHEHYNGIQIVLMTGKGDGDHVVSAVEHGCDAYIEKPWRRDFFLSTVESAVNEVLQASPH